MNFNKSQMEAISFMTGQSMVLAGPGSGKTTVITHRIKHLIEKGVAPDKILVITFTKKAAEHMKEKFLQVMKKSNATGVSYPVAFGTFHSVYFKILRIEKNYTAKNILRDYEKNQILKEIAIRKRINVRSMNDYLSNTSGDISNVKGNMLPINQYCPKSTTMEEFRSIYNEYSKELKLQGKIDFDDMLADCFSLLKENPSILKKWQQVYQYILIDEFQDINMIQYQVVRLLAEPENNLFIVGDDDQSIYGFRGACPKLMFKFGQDFNDYREIILNINYRSTANIVEISNLLIKNNRERFVKNIKTEKRFFKDPEIKLFKNQFEELENVAKKIKELNKQGVPSKEIAVLVRNNAQINEIEKHLMNRHIKSKSAGGQKTVYKTMVGMDIISYVKAALLKDRISTVENINLVRIINKPARCISRNVLSMENMSLLKMKQMYIHNREMVNTIEKLNFDLEMIKKLKPTTAVTYILKGVGYEKYLYEYAKENKIKIATLLEHVEKVRQDGGKFATLEQWIGNVENDCHTNNTCNSKYKNNEKYSEDEINIMTMHSSKGLEFEAVFVIDVIQGVIPTSKAVLTKDYEEERRVFYVAITRAKKYLYVYGVMENLGCKVEESIFMQEIVKSV